jgi:hypothetical protein
MSWPNTRAFSGEVDAGSPLKARQVKATSRRREGGTGSKPSWLARLSVAAITLLVTACQNYEARRDTISFHAGEAAAYNKAIHTVDPWPAASARTDIEFDGRRMVQAVERYGAGGASEAAGGPPPVVALPMPAIAAPAAAR